MKNPIIVALLLIPCMLGAHEYTSQSKLKEGKYVKIRVEQTGFYRLTYSEIRALGLNPQHIAVLGYGGNLINQDFRVPYKDDLPVVAFYMHKGDDNVFGEGDYICFYGQGSVGWEYKDNKWQHTRNCYSDFGYYFLTDNPDYQHIIETEGDVLDYESDANSVRTTEDHQLHEQDLVNLMDPTNGKAGGGREWYGEEMFADQSNTFGGFNFNHIAYDKEMKVRVVMEAKSEKYTTVSATIGDKTGQTITPGIDVADHSTMGVEGIINMVALPPSTSPRVSITLMSDAAVASRLNYIEMTARCYLEMDNEPLFIRNTEFLQAGGLFTPSADVNLYKITGNTTGVQVWNMTDPCHISGVKTFYIGDTLCFTGHAHEVEEFVAIRPQSTTMLSPKVIGNISNQNLHQLRDIDHVIITPDEFLSAANQLARAHEQKEGVIYAVVTEQQVFNEFSSGTPDASAYRRLMKMLYDRAEEDPTLEHPKTLLLLGDGTYDNRKLAQLSGDRILLTYQAVNSLSEPKAYATDDYFGMLEDEDGMIGNAFYDSNGTMEIGVGRLPARTAEQAQNMVNKIIRYMADENPGKWKQELCFLADDGDHGLHVEIGDAAAEQVRVDNPDFIVNKIFLDAYVQEATASGESYPVAFAQFDNLMKNGVLMMDYSGHGSANNICSEGFLTIADVKKMSNRNQGFWMLATCSYAHFDQAETSSAEEAVLNPNGGAIGVISACRTVYAAYNRIINMNVCDMILYHEDAHTYPYTIGEAICRAKNLTGVDENKLPYIYLGDPALRLNYPTQYEVVATTALDTLQALSKHTVRGFIRNAEGDTARDFNGMLAVTIFDKMQVVSTRDNDESDDSKKRVINYNDYPNRLFKGEASVVNGEWEFTFMLPKDIHYNYGYGRMVFYAMDRNLGEALGHKEDFTIGGSADYEILDHEGPQIYPYINTPYFINGNKSNNHPHFYALLADTSGINTVGSGIGHDLMLTVDNDLKQAYIMNDYYTADRGTYQSGMVSYAMNTLEDGPHTLRFKAWDLLNNSSEADLQFVVDKDVAPNIVAVISYPNPAKNTDVIHFRVLHDMPDDFIYATLHITNLMGSTIRLDKDFHLDGDITLDLNVHPLPCGIYGYKITIHTATSDITTDSSKFIIYQ